MITLSVWFMDPAGQIHPAGKIAADRVGRQRRPEAEFQYDERFLDSATGIDLDPRNMPLSRERYRASSFVAGERDGLHPVFLDALPDAWGRHLLVRQYAPAQEPLSAWMLQCLGARTLGALKFTPDDQPPVLAPALHGADLGELMRVARKIEDGLADELTSDERALIYRAGPSAGGARPKVLIAKEGRHWIAKFPSRTDRFDVVRIEAATMDLARRCGIVTAHTQLQETAPGPALLVERFDLTPAGGARHVLSFKTLLDAPEYGVFGYSQLAEALRFISRAPRDDAKALYRQMVFNAAVGNTDDHLKNFEVLRDEQGWRLSPAFDLLPNLAGNLEHQLRFLHDGYAPNQTDLFKVAALFAIPVGDAEEAIEAVLGTFATWRAVFAEHGLGDAALGGIAADIDRRVRRLGIR